MHKYNYDFAQYICPNKCLFNFNNLFLLIVINIYKTYALDLEYNYRIKQ